MTIEVTAALIVNEGKLLAARRSPGKHLAGYWEFPGGKIENGETPKDCLLRELFEELSIHAVIGRYIGDSIHNYGDKLIRLHGYEIKEFTGDIQLREHDELQWLDIDQLDSVKWAPADIPLIEKYKAYAQTISYYSYYAKEYCEETVQFDVEEIQLKFLEYLKPGSKLLDLGCGSGRDSKYFRDKGYDVVSIDENHNIAEWAIDYTGHEVLVMPFNEVKFPEKFDGIWACSSLLHCHENELVNTIEELVVSLKPSGYFYMSFKWGEESTTDINGRYFVNKTADSLQKLIRKIPTVFIVEIWESEAKLRNNIQKWINVIIQKKEL
jgi:mutator protein MutT